MMRNRDPSGVVIEGIVPLDVFPDGSTLPTISICFAKDTDVAFDKGDMYGSATKFLTQHGIFELEDSDELDYMVGQRTGRYPMYGNSKRAHQKCSQVLVSGKDH